MKKITFLLPDLLPGGAQRVVSSLCKYLTIKEYKVDLLLITNLGVPSLYSVPNVRVQYLSPFTNFLPINVVVSFFKLYFYLRNNQTDILISSLTGTNIFAIIVKLFSNSKTPLILREDNVLLNISNKFTLHLMKWLYPRADKIICVSKEIEDELANTLRISRTKMQTINNPIDLQRILSMAKEKPGHNWFCDQQMPILTAVGRLTEAKGFDILIKAFSEVIKQYPARLLILGDGPLRSELNNLIQSLQLENQVDLVGIKTNPYSYLINSKLFVLSSRWEGFVYVLLEAMALGTPVVATNCHSGPYEILLQGKLGKLVEVNSIASLANGIIYTLKNRQNTDALVKRVQDFSLEKISLDYIDVIETV